jgi:U3 small nucleolar ribonucleoprotein protein IMP4
MLITTSRKPSQKTRTFGRALQRVLPAIYVNRGKMNLREVLLKSLEQGSGTVVVISEMKGNPSRLEFYKDHEEPELTLLVNVDLSPPPGRITKDELGFRCKDPLLRKSIQSLLGLKEHQTENNLIMIKNGGLRAQAVMEFHDQQSRLVRPRIYIKEYKVKEKVDETS